MLIYELREPSGKLVAQCLSEEACLREASWRDIVGGTITLLHRGPSWGYDAGHPRRYVARWPDKKLVDFGARYRSGYVLRDLEAYFETSISSICKLARKLGCPKRSAIPENWGKHAGRWTSDEDALVLSLYLDKKSQIEDRGRQAVIREISQSLDRSWAAVYFRLMYKAYVAEISVEQAELLNFMYDEGFAVHEIAEHLKILPGAVESVLRETAQQYSTRSSRGIFIHEKRKGSIRRVLET